MSNYYCRLCSKQCLPEESLLFSKQISEMVEYCIPEFDITLVPNPIVCKLCNTLLKQTENFKRRCLAVQDNIRKLMSNRNPTESSTAISNSTFDDSYKTFLQNGIPDLKEPQVTEETNILKFSSAEDDRPPNDDEFLDLLESSSNIKIEVHDNELNNYSYNEEAEMEDADPLWDKSQDESKTSLSRNVLLSEKDPLFVKLQKTYCFPCKTRFADISGLVAHLYTVHLESKDMFACLLCRYKTSNLKNIKNHYKTSHTNCMDLKGSCLFCKKNYITFSQLYLHMRIEHKQFCKSERYYCSSCDFRIRSYDSFRRHFFRSHDVVCNYCLKVCENIEALNRHIVRHCEYAKR